jgi:hypothetical protein
MFKKFALWLCPTELVTRDLLDSSHDLLLRRIRECEQLKKQLAQKSIELDGTIEDLAFSKVYIETTKTRSIELISKIQSALKKRIEVNTRKYSFRTIVDRQTAILDEITTVIGAQ